ncbi:MAG: macro domain-containing protein [Spirochaetes bacterium]|nr:macro domain-containing protein [Spirochaetota bacterium]
MIISEFTLPENPQVKIVLKQGDITEEKVDAIVNAANSELQHGGGVAGAIVSKGGYSIQTESSAIGYVEVGESALTNAGTLNAKKIIHTVGPRWGEGNEPEKLASAVYNSLKLADKENLRTISFPAVSSGIFGFPKDQCAQVMFESVKKYLTDNQYTELEQITFCIIDTKTITVFQKEFSKLIK